MSVVNEDAEKYLCYICGEYGLASREVGGPVRILEYLNTVIYVGQRNLAIMLFLPFRVHL